MKKLVANILIITAILIIASVKHLFAQDEKFNADSSITYQQNHFKKGDTVQLFYGSGNNKGFEFIEIVNISLKKISSGKAPSDFSKHKVVLNGTSFIDGKCFLSAKIPWVSDADNYVKINIDVEGAIDNKELIAPNNIAVIKKPATKKKK